MANNEIRFYSTFGGSVYATFSNFHCAPFLCDGKSWPTVEHYFQAQKFPNAAYRETIRKALTPTLAKRLGNVRYGQKLRVDWEEVKEPVMCAALRAKFTSHPHLSDLLLNTGDKKLVEASPRDYYWGGGCDGTGQNRLGVLLMELREELRDEMLQKEI